MIAPDPLAALAEATRRILVGSGRADLAEVLERGTLQLVDGGETWMVGPRTLVAQRLALVVGTDDFIRLRGSSDDHERLRDAVAAAVRSPTTELADLMLVLALPWIRATWEASYRDAPMAPPDDASDAAVLEGAAALLDALGDAAARSALERAELESAELPTTDVRLRRFVLRLPADALARAESDPDLADRLRRSVTHAATRARSRVADVELRLRTET